MATLLPNFLIIGAPRSGTTLLHRILQDHPSIFVAQPKEIYSAGDVHYFDISSKEGKENFERGLSWYSDHFRSAPEGVLVGEKTADYLADPEAPALIRRTLGPSINLVVVLRDPVARAYSHYWYARPHLFPKMPFSDALETSLGRRVLVEPGFYHRHISRYAEHFQPESLLVIISDDLYENPAREAGNVCRFLGLDAARLPERSPGVVNRAIVGGTAYQIERLGSWLREKHPRFLVAIKRSPGIAAMKKVLASSRNVGSGSDSRPSGYPPMGEEDRTRLERIYAEDVRHLRTLLGRDQEKLWPHIEIC